MHWSKATPVMQVLIIYTGTVQHDRDTVQHVGVQHSSLQAVQSPAGQPSGCTCMFKPSEKGTCVCVCVYCMKGE